MNEYAAVGLSPDQTYAFMVMADYAIGQWARDTSPIEATAISSELAIGR